MPEVVAPPASARPPLKWAGGKRWQVPHLKPLWAPHEHRRLVEPFCGGLAVSLGLQPAKALLGDANPHLISFYQWLKRGLAITMPFENKEKSYYRHRRRFNELMHTEPEGSEAALLFYYLNRTGYNGLCRFNSKGEFNVPFGTYKKIGYAPDFSQYVDAFAEWEFRHGDFEDLTVRTSDFIYADPPYDVEFTHYSKGGFSWDDQVRAARFVARHKGPAILVNQATPRIIELYGQLGFHLRFENAPRRISCTGDRKPAREVIALRNL
jgi:DNA adenine methylase